MTYEIGAGFYELCGSLGGTVLQSPVYIAAIITVAIILIIVFMCPMKGTSLGHIAKIMFYIFLVNVSAFTVFRGITSYGHDKDSRTSQVERLANGETITKTADAVQIKEGGYNTSGFGQAPGHAPGMDQGAGGGHVEQTPDTLSADQEESVDNMSNEQILEWLNGSKK